MRNLIAIGVLVVPLALTGCGGSDGGPRLPTIKVNGKLLVDDKPFGPCQVILSSTDADAPGSDKAKSVKTVSGVTKSDGTFELRTYTDGDGAPVGSYKVTIAPDNELKPGSSSTKSMMDNGVPVCKPLTVEIAKPADGKPLQLELKLESTGEKSNMPGGMMQGGGMGGMGGMNKP